jgi:hypothetical protein
MSRIQTCIPSQPPGIQLLLIKVHTQLANKPNRKGQQIPPMKSNNNIIGVAVGHCGLLYGPMYTHKYIVLCATAAVSMHCNYYCTCTVLRSILQKGHMILLAARRPSICATSLLLLLR